MEKQLEVLFDVCNLKGFNNYVLTSLQPEDPTFTPIKEYSEFQIIQKRLAYIYNAMSESERDRYFPSQVHGLASRLE